MWPSTAQVTAATVANRFFVKLKNADSPRQLVCNNITPMRNPSAIGHEKGKMWLICSLFPPDIKTELISSVNLANQFDQNVSLSKLRTILFGKMVS